ncbi:hypothetical protein QO010_001558 [Caulobacter ginsengisoli]|uniref:Uncharacterized protein n=1 Tax=Caulobacter ginsengisoli TaxID=400775 RepID=A0ABU0IS64_9CAUL|nr:hypothetical protein [Caulobacter ginsengisoli]
MIMRAKTYCQRPEGLRLRAPGWNLSGARLNSNT